MPLPLFVLGRLVGTPGALKALTESGENGIDYLKRHATGDWGDLSEFDRGVNNEALKDGWRVLSAYHLATGVKIWIITEADRSVTTILLPEDY